MASARNHNKRFPGLVGRTIEEIVQLAGLLVGAPVIVGLKMQGYVEYEMIGDLLGKDTRQRVRTQMPLLPCSWAIDEGNRASATWPTSSGPSMVRLPHSRKPKCLPR